MSDEQPTFQQNDSATTQGDSIERKNAATREPIQRASRRPRPSPAYTAGRRASMARHRTPIEPQRNRKLLIVPIIAVVALLILAVAVITDRLHTTGNAAPAPTVAVPSATAAPTKTPIPMAAPPTTKSGVAAEINGEIVPMDLYSAVVRVDANGLQIGGTDQTTGQPIAPVDLTTSAGLKQFHQHERDDLNQLIQTAAAVAYAKQHKLVATAKQAQDALNNLYSQNGGKAAFLKQVKAEGYSEANVIKIITDGTTEQHVFAVIGKKAPYDGKTVRHILIDLKNQALATKLAKELQADKGSNFADLAKKNSTDTQTASQGGSLGVVIKGDLDPAVDKAILSLKQGQISNPIKIASGWEIVQVLGPGQSQTSQSNYFTNWLKQQQAKATIYVKIPNP